MIDSDVEVNKKTLRRHLDKFNINQQQIKQRSDFLGLSVKGSKEIQDLFKSIQYPFEAILTNGDKILAADEVDKFRRYGAAVARQETKFVHYIDEIGRQHNFLTQKSIKNLSAIEICLAMLIIAIIILEIIFLINPVLRRLVKRTTELNNKKVKLEEQADFIKGQNIQLQIAKEEAEEANIAKSQFLSNISHEIRTPLNAIVGMSHILISKDPRSDQKEDIETIVYSAENLMVIINDILDYNKIEAGKMEFENSGFDLRFSVNKTFKTLQPVASKKQLKFDFSIDDQVPNFLLGDQTRLSQILINLLNNAIKFTKHGSVKMRVYCTEKSEKNVRIHFSISDTGIGIPKEKQAKIFESFTQADPSTTRLYGGTGLGLAITKRLIELQNGTLNLQSEVGEGSTFFFHLDYALDKNVKATPPSSGKAVSDLSGIQKILLVEDNSLNIMVAQNFMKKWKLESDVANDGQEALELIKDNDYSLVLMDLQMPNMDGYKATSIIRSWNEPKYQNLPIVALSASALAEFKDKAHEVGMNDYLCKPFKPLELYEIIKKNAISEQAANN
jgi:signal transduction histidine kinase/ActR/RegA family two-component response regulator